MRVRVLVRRLVARVEHELAERDYWNAIRLQAQQLRRAGMKLAPVVMLGGPFDVDGPLELVEFGPFAGIGERTLLMTRDLAPVPYLGVRLEAPIRFQEFSGIPIDCIATPGVTLGARSIVAAGSVILRDIPADSGALGNPAYPRPVGKRWYLARLQDIRDRPHLYQERGPFTLPTAPWPNLPREGVHIERDLEEEPDMSGMRRRLRRVLSWAASQLRETDEDVLSRERIRRLRKSGAVVGEGCFIAEGAWFDPRPGIVRIGDNCLIGRQAVLVGHDGMYQLWTGLVRVEPIHVRDGSVIGPRAVLMPGITVGPCSIVLPGAIVAKDVPPYTVVEGSPARPVMSIYEWLRRVEADRQAHPERYLRDDRVGRVTLPPESEVVPAVGVASANSTHASA